MAASCNFRTASFYSVAWRPAQVISTKGRNKNKKSARGGLLRSIRIIAAGVAAAAAMFLAAPVYAQTSSPPQKPLFEIGAFGYGGYFPDYPGSKQNHFQFIPLPFFIYRGSFLRMTPQSVSGVFIENKTLHFDLSASGAFHTSSNDLARYGMPKLQDMAEAGPRLNLVLARDAQTARIEFEVPVRAVLSTDFKSLNYRGWKIAPELAYIQDNLWNTGGRLKLGIEGDYADKQLMNYFYGVAPQYVTSTRARYTAHGGYLGSSLDASYLIPLNKRMTLYTRISGSYYGGATNAASPLLKSDLNFTTAAGLTFSFYQSDEMASDRE